jgi:type I restriction enzyme S subunit
VATLSPSYSGTAPEPGEIFTVVPMDLLSVGGAIDVTNQQELADIPPGLTLFEKGDVLLAKITTCMENGKGALVKELPTRYAFGSTEFHVLRPGGKIDGAFLYFATHNPVFGSYAAENMVGAAGQKRVSSRFVKDTRLFLPSLAEQPTVAAYLDSSCAAIDAAVDAKRRQLETLERTRESITEGAITSGIGRQPEGETGSAVPKLPAEWRTIRLKRIAEIRYGLGQPPPETDGGVPMIRATDIDAGKILDGNFLCVDPEGLPRGRDPYLKDGEIIVVRSGAYTGDSAIVTGKQAGAVAGYDR